MPQTIDNLLATWANSGTTFTAFKFNVVDSASASGSLLMDLQVGGSSRFSVRKDGAVTSAQNITANSVNALVDLYWTRDLLALATNASIKFTADTILTRRAAASLRLGAADAASPVAQTLGVQSVTGVADTAGANFTIAGSQGTGTGAGGSIVFQVAPAGLSGPNQNALETLLTINPNRTVDIGGLTINPANGGTTFQQTFAITMQTLNAFVIRHGNSDGLDVRPVSSGSPNILLKNASNAIQAALWGEANNTLALRNGAAAQAFRVYNTTDGTNLERGFMRWSSNVLQIGTEKAGTGTARALELQTNGVTRLTFGAAGGLTIAAGNFIGVNSRYLFDAAADGVVRIANWADNDFNRLQFGGTTSSFPAIKRSSTTLQARLADDSAFASVQGKITTETAYTAGAPTATGYLVIYDSNGVAYKVAAEAL